MEATEDKSPRPEQQASSSSNATAFHQHLSYPSPSVITTPSASTSQAAQPRPLLVDRLYVGNLHPTVDEYTLLQLFTKFGKVSKLDFLFHKSGPLKGKPRGYAFVEFAQKDDADKALAHAHGKLLRGRKLVITYAQQAPVDSTSQGQGSKHRRGISEVAKPTTLSMLKSAGNTRIDATDAKIAKMEAKLRQLETQTPGSSSSTSGHASLPPKPMGAPVISSTKLASAYPGSSKESSRSELPRLPLTQPKNPRDRPTDMGSRGVTPKKAPLSGVRIMKSKGRSVDS